MARAPRPAACSQPTRRRACCLVAGAALSLGLTACEPDPDAKSLDDWYYGLGTVLVQNTTVARSYQKLAGDIKKTRKKGKLNAGAIAGRIEADIVPLAQGLVEQGGRVRPATAEFQPTHDALMGIWTERVEAYEQALSAFEDADVDGIRAAMSACRDVSDAEAQWFDTTNATLAPRGYRFEQFPEREPSRPTN